MAGSLTNRVFRAAKLDTHLYEEVESDKTATPQAMLVVILSGIAAGIGSISISKESIIYGAFFAVLGWFLWATLIYFIGTKLLPKPQTKTNFKTLLRAIGFSCSPGLIRVFGILPEAEKIVFPVAELWILVAMVVAVKQVLNYKGIVHSAIVCLISYLAMKATCLLISSICFNHLIVLPKPA
jgi:hypothetical protein